jgi:hypothetical protein
MKLPVLSCALVLGVLLPDRSLLAQPPSLRQEIAALFEAGWSGTAASRGAADRAFEEISVGGRADPRSGYAYALVLMKQRRYEQAITELDGVLKLDESNLAARENKIRLLMLTKNYSGAVVELDRLSRLAAEAPQEHLPLDRRRDVLRFIGRVIGFLEGPGEAGIAAVTRQRAQREIESRLTDEELGIYDEARDGVLERFGKSVGQAETGREDALTEKQRQREEAKRDLQTQRTQQQERATELLARADQLRKEIKDNETEFAKAERPLVDRLARLDRQAEIPRRELALLLADSDSLRAAAARTEDPVERDRLLFRAQQLEIFAARYDADLAVLERQAAAVNAERAQIRDRFGRENAALVASGTTIKKELELLGRGEKRLAMDEKRFDKPITGGTRAVRALEAEAGAFTTYEPLPLEEERQRLLDLLK